MFWRKQVTKVDETTPTDRLRRIEHRLTVLEGEVLDIAATLTTIRTKIMKQIKVKHVEEEVRDDSDPQSLYDRVLLKEK